MKLSSTIGDYMIQDITKNNVSAGETTKEENVKSDTQGE
jgi:hypothetical protein